MYSKIKITGTIEILTGMHIGGSSAFAAIGAVDSPVMRDSLSDLPIIPGSSLKGKMRTLLAKKYNDNIITTVDNDSPKISRLFGSSKKNAIKASRLIFSDSILSNLEDLKKKGLNSAEEVKFENTISRLTAVANPRQIERVVRGSEFIFSLIYNAENEEEIAEDIEVLADGFKMLQYDYLGGHGSRGYGRVAIKNLKTEVVIGEVEKDILEECTNILEGAEFSEV